MYQLVLLVLLLVPAATYSGSIPAPSLIKISEDPYIFGVGQHRTEVEPDTFAYGSTIVAAFQVGRMPSGAGAANIGWATSRDRGTTWIHGFLPGITTIAGGVYDRVSDPAVAYNAAYQVWLIESMPFFSIGSGMVSVVVNRSTDDGLTWSAPISVTTMFGLDKPWIVCDNYPTSPFYGHCYAEWDAGGVFMSTSTDGGATWGPPQTPGARAYGYGGQPVVQPDGTVIVPVSSGGMIVFASHDGGASWSSPTLIDNFDMHRPAGRLRTHPFPSAEVDGTGTVYVVWSDCRFRPACSANDIVMSTSADGVTWSAVKRIPIAPLYARVDSFTPGVGVDPATIGDRASLGLTYYYYPEAACTEITCELSVGFIASPDGGTHWTVPLRLAGPMQPVWLASTDQGYMAGDYISTSVVEGQAYPAFAVAQAPGLGMLDEAMYTVAGGIDLDSLPLLPPTPEIFLPLIGK